MITTFLILAVSLTLFVYWFRYTALMIVRAGCVPGLARKLAEVNQLTFANLQQQLCAGVPDQSLPSLRQALEREYRLLKYLLGYAGSAGASGYTAQQRMLMFNFRLVGVWFRAVRRFRPGSARLALLEMADTLGYFATVTGNRLAAADAQAN